MVQNLYVCKNCKQAFYYEEKEAESGLCRNCLQKKLQKQTKKIILNCPQCFRHYDVSKLIQHKVNFSMDYLKFEIDLGRLLCPKDKIPLEASSLEDEFDWVSKHVYSTYSELQQHEIHEESAFIQKMHQYRDETAEEAASDITAPEIKIGEEKVGVPITDYSQILPIPLPFIPYGNEFWDFYFNKHGYESLKEYPGGNRQIQKIKSFLDEVNTHILNPDKIDLRFPIIENLKRAKLIFVGDTHGSVQDTDKIIHYCVNEIRNAEYHGRDIRIIFLGDYVDRNEYDIHNMLYIFAFALKYPFHIRLLRGNHEEVMVNMNYGFWENVNDKFPNSYLFNDFGYTFANFPLIYVAQSEGHKIMALHGGIPFYSPSKRSDRRFLQSKDSSIYFPEIPNLLDGSVQLDSIHPTIDDMDGLSKQILWSDPARKLPLNHYYIPSPRGLGFLFGEKVFTRWREINQVDYLIRAHEAFMDGYKEFFGGRLISLFSSSNYLNKKIQAKILEMDLTKPENEQCRYITIQTDLKSLD
ncbi:MAG: metallophosphoesterase family protein [Promethearchaeota archaeon]